MALDENDAPEQLELTAQASKKTAKLQAKRESLLRAVNSSRLNTIEERVAWLLNNYPKTRDSDIALQVRYWREFEPDHFAGGDLSVSDYYRLTKLTSVAHARATIQNDLNLFQACDEVKKRRKKLEESERQNAIKRRPNCHQFTVYLDESGKTQDNVIVGSLWYLSGIETLKIHNLVQDWKKSHGFDGELHFQSITETKLPSYLELADLIAANSAMLSFKSLSVERRGISNTHDALLRLSSHLLVKGIEHENQTGRAPLPRGLSVCKDAEEPGKDKIFAAELTDRMKQTAASQFQGDLFIDEFSAEDSSNNIHLQITDLFASSIGRQLNAHGERKHHKDEFADYFLKKVRYSNTPKSEMVGDMTVHITL